MILVLNNSETAPQGALDINVTSRSTTWSRVLSPFILKGGKTWTGEEAWTVEGIWQFCKVYECHVDANNEPMEDYFIWMKRGWKAKTGIRYPMGKGAIPLYSYWNCRKYSYLDAKEKLYVKMYFRSVRTTEAYKKLEELYKECLKSKTILVLRDFDAYNHVNLKLTPYEVLRHPTKKFGHGFVLMFMLMGLLDERGNFIKEVKKDINDIKFF